MPHGGTDCATGVPEDDLRGGAHDGLGLDWTLLGLYWTLRGARPVRGAQGERRPFLPVAARLCKPTFVRTEERLHPAAARPCTQCLSTESTEQRWRCIRLCAQARIIGTSTTCRLPLPN